MTWLQEDLLAVVTPLNYVTNHRGGPVRQGLSLTLMSGGLMTDTVVQVRKRVGVIGTRAY